MDKEGLVIEGNPADIWTDINLTEANKPKHEKLEIKGEYATMKPHTRKFQEVDAKFLAFPQEETLLPKRGTSGSAGYDFFSKEDVVIKPGSSHVFTTDIKAFMSNPFEFLAVVPRGGFGFGGQHLTLTNTLGIIDSDFYNSEDGGGNIKISIYNNGDKEKTFSIGDKIGQGIFIPYLVTSDDNAKAVRTGGFHSTGI